MSVVAVKAPQFDDGALCSGAHASVHGHGVDAAHGAVQNGDLAVAIRVEGLQHARIKAAS